jgi:hypothetical protein
MCGNQRQLKITSTFLAIAGSYFIILYVLPLRSPQSLLVESTWNSLQSGPLNEDAWPNFSLNKFRE